MLIGLEAEDKQNFPYIYAQRRLPLRLSMYSLRIKMPIDIIQVAKISYVISSTAGRALNLVGIKQKISKELFERITSNIAQALQIVL